MTFDWSRFLFFLISAIPVATAADENLRCLGSAKGDKYHAEDIALHELIHGIEEISVKKALPDFYKRLKKTFKSATSKGLWKGTYAETNPTEYLVS